MGPLRKGCLTPKGAAIHGLRTTGLGLCGSPLILYIIRCLSQTMLLSWIKWSWTYVVSQKSSDCLLFEVSLSIPTAFVFPSLVGTGGRPEAYHD